MEKTEQKDRKKASWRIAKDIATCVFPDGRTENFDVSKIDQTVLVYYGAKQWLSDQVASEKSVGDKIAGMRAAYDEAVKAGLVITETGKVQIVGKVRANATGPRTQDNLILPALSTYTAEELAGLKVGIKLGLVKVSDELKAKIDAMETPAPAKNEKGKK